MADRALNLLLVEARAAIRRGLRMRIALEPDLLIVGEAADREVGLHLARQLDADVIVLALNSLEEVGALRAFACVAPRSRLVVLTPHEMPAGVGLSADVGPVGLISKHQSPEALLAAIRAIGSPAPR